MNGFERMNPAAAGTANGARVVSVEGNSATVSAPASPATPPSSGKSSAVGDAFFTWEKSGREVFVAQISEFKGQKFLNLRIWTQTHEGLKPTGKGATLPLGGVRALGEALRTVDLPGL